MTKRVTELYELPTTMTDRQREAVDIVMRVAQELEPRTLDNGCRDFYTPAEWRARGEAYGHDGVLIVVHDGGNLAPLFNHDYGCSSWVRAMRKSLEAVGFYVEACTPWYSAVFCTRKDRQAVEFRNHGPKRDGRVRLACDNTLLSPED